MARESFKDSYYGGLVYDNETITQRGNKAYVSGIDSDGNRYTNYFKRRKDGSWGFDGYNGNYGQVTSTKPKFNRSRVGMNGGSGSRPDRAKDQRAMVNMRHGNKSK